MGSWRQKRERWLLLAPALIILGAVTVSPLFQTAWLSFTDTEITSRSQTVSWIGIENYSYALTDPDFHAALWRTLYFTIVSVGLETVIAIAVALFLEPEDRRFERRPEFFHEREVVGSREVITRESDEERR